MPIPGMSFAKAQASRLAEGAETLARRASNRVQANMTWGAVPMERVGAKYTKFIERNGWSRDEGNQALHDKVGHLTLDTLEPSTSGEYKAFIAQSALRNLMIDKEIRSLMGYSVNITKKLPQKADDLFRHSDEPFIALRERTKGAFTEHFIEKQVAIQAFNNKFSVGNFKINKIELPSGAEKQLKRLGDPSSESISHVTNQLKEFVSRKEPTPVPFLSAAASKNYYPQARQRAMEVSPQLPKLDVDNKTDDYYRILNKQIDDIYVPKSWGQK
jgi:hypothetical protein